MNWESSPILEVVGLYYTLCFWKCYFWERDSAFIEVRFHFCGHVLVFSEFVFCVVAFQVLQSGISGADEIVLSNMATLLDCICLDVEVSYITLSTINGCFHMKDCLFVWTPMWNLLWFFRILMYSHLITKHWESRLTITSLVKIIFVLWLILGESKLQSLYIITLFYMHAQNWLVTLSWVHMVIYSWEKKKIISCQLI